MNWNLNTSKILKINYKGIHLWKIPFYDKNIPKVIYALARIGLWIGGQNSTNYTQVSLAVDLLPISPAFRGQEHGFPGYGQRENQNILGNCTHLQQWQWFPQRIDQMGFYCPSFGSSHPQ